MIFKFQQGGSTIPPLVSYQPIMITNSGASETASTAGSSKSSEESSDLTDKDLLKMLKDLDGLPNDMQALTKVLQNFYIDQQYSPSPNTANIASRYLQALQMMRTANFNRKQYDEAFNIVSSNGGINELAINEKGQLICVNKDGDFKYLKPEQLAQTTDYQPVTNSELLRLRAYNPELAGDNRILGVVANGIGIDSVIKYIKDSISNLGTTDTSQQGYISTQQGQIITGIQTLTNAIQTASQNGIKFDGTTQDLYQYKIINKTQKEQADAALKYIYTTLPENAKTLLKTRTNSGTDQDAQKLIATIISSQIDYTNQYDIELKAGKTAQKASKDTSGTKDATEQETSFLSNIQQSIGGSTQGMTIDTGTGIQMTVEGSYYPQVTKPNGDAITDTSMSQMLADSHLMSLIKNNKSITYGDQKITPEQLKNITYNNTGVLRANLPIKSDGTVNLDLLVQYQQAEAEMNATNDPQKRGEILKKHGLSDLLKSNGTPDEKKFGAFIVAEGYTTERNGIKKSDFVKYIKDPSDEQIDLIKRSLTTGTGKDKQTPEIDTFSYFNPLDYIFGVDDIFKAAVYIPISSNQLTAITGANQHIDYDEAMNLEQKYQSFEKNINQRPTSADILGL